MPIDAGPCSCPEGWPRLIHHKEDGFPIMIVRHHDRCLLDSVRVSGVRLPAAVYEQRLVAVIGEKG